MPGIAGIINKSPSAINDSILDVMIESMNYEYYYSSGKYHNEQMGVSIGWVVHKDEFSSCLPIINDTKDIVLIFYGETHFDDNNCNPSYLIQLYEKNEKLFFKHLNGWFCGLVIDMRKNKAILFNDIFGMQRLYFHEGKDSFFFSSEAKSILNVMPALKDIPAQSLAELFYCQCVLENRSLFRDIFLLPGGSCWEIRAGSVMNRQRYFDPKEYEDLPPLKREDFYRELTTTFRSILQKYVSPDDQIAFSLTGGMDTRTILANITKGSPNIRCYSHCGDYRECYDVKTARKIAKMSGLVHHTLRIDDNFYTVFPMLAEKTAHISDGYMDLSGVPSLYLHGKARNLGNIRLTGNFGDQALHNVLNLFPYKSNLNFLNEDYSIYLKAAETCLGDLSQGNPLSFFLFKQAPWFDYARYSVEKSQLIQRSPFMDIELIKLLYQAPKGLLASEDVRMRLIREGNPDLAKIPTDRGIDIDQRGGLFSIIHLYREILFKSEYRFREGMPQGLAKINNALLFLKLEYLFLDTHKYYNMRRIFRYQMADYIKGILLDSRALNRPYIDKNMLEKMVVRHTSGSGNYTDSLNRILSVELAFRKLIE